MEHCADKQIEKHANGCGDLCDKFSFYSDVFFKFVLHLEFAFSTLKIPFLAQTYHHRVRFHFVFVFNDSQNGQIEQHTSKHPNDEDTAEKRPIVFV